MKHLIISVLCLLVLIFAAQPVWATTYAYIPSHDNDSLVRVDTGASTFTSLDFSPNAEDTTCGPYGAAVTPDGSLVLVTCSDEGSLAFIGTAGFSSNSRTTAVAGSAPQGVAIEPNGLYAYVANFGNNTVTKFNITSQTMSGDPISVGNGPWGIAAVSIVSGGSAITKVYVANNADGTVTVITDSGTPAVSKAIAGFSSPIGVAATPNGNFVYVANNTGGVTGSVGIISTNTDTLVGTIANVGLGPWGVAVGSQGDYVYVSNNSATTLSNTVTIIDASTNTILYNAANTAFGNYPYGIAAPKNGDFAYVINQEGSNADTIDKIAISSSTVTVTNIPVDSTTPINTAFAIGAFIGGTPPAKPSGLTGVATDAVKLTWTDNSSASELELGLKIERRVKGTTAYTQIAEVAAGTESYTDIAVASKTTYEYRVRAYNEAADSAYATTPADSITTQEGGFSWCFIGTLLR